MSTETPERTEADRPAPARPGWRPAALFGIAMVAVLVIAVLAGSLVGSTSTPSEDSVDVGFAQDMSVHHRQAVEMAAWERDNTRDPALKQLAYDIESTQNQQIGRMQGWLGLWEMPALPTGTYMTWMADDPSMSGHSGMDMSGGVDRMPGMATSDDLRRLRTTTGPAMDVVFLQLMLRHHEGGVSMLTYGRDHAETSEVRNLAGQMLVSQTAETDLMKSLLTQRGGQPLPL
ncbi:DUF305 domain-containing protein [Pseudonocardia endophytica]|uniref:Uncharacterized protein (DUF305 family) n=1 Tax=Pseudonocardia endophytica TaxID=401976 RepID=A0A4R1HTF9_PSEEN|nr:DUF305 domain-containing protein [Pseudonocardia endophytica]TCK20702.1 uncharacterized protein (DUF305 family) [Pseudonocardia endophytica]